MLSRRWPRPKWIKYITVQIGFAHLSGWNVTLYLQLKRSFFSQPGIFLSKVFLGQFTSDVTIIWSTKVQKSIRLRDFGREDCHPSHSDQNKEPDAPPIKHTFQHYNRRLIAYRPKSHTVPQHQISRSRTAYTHSLPDLLSGGRRRSASLLTYQLLFV